MNKAIEIANELLAMAAVAMEAARKFNLGQKFEAAAPFIDSGIHFLGRGREILEDVAAGGREGAYDNLTPDEIRARFYAKGWDELERIAREQAAGGEEPPAF